MGETQVEIIKWAVTQGGLVGVLVTVVWSYRRDFTRLMAKDDEKLAVLTDLVAQARLSHEQTRMALDSLRGTVAGLQQAIDELRRMLERMS